MNIEKTEHSHNLQTTYALLSKPNDKIPLENQGTYCIRCGECKQQYIKQSNRRISVRVKQQQHKNKIDIFCPSHPQLNKIKK